MNFFSNSSTYHDIWYQSGQSFACDSFVHPSTQHLYLAQPPPSSEPPPQAPPVLSVADSNHHQPPGPIWFSGRSSLPPPLNHNQQQAFLGDFRPWEREYDPSTVIFTSYSSIQHSYIQNFSSMPSYEPPTFSPMATPSIPVSNYKWPAPEYCMPPENQPTIPPYILNSTLQDVPTSDIEKPFVSSSQPLHLPSFTSYTTAPTTQPTPNADFSYKLLVTNNEPKVFEEMPERSSLTNVLMTSYGHDEDPLYFEDSSAQQQSLTPAFTNSEFQIPNHHSRLSISPSQFPNSFTKQLPQLPELRLSSMVTVDESHLGDKEVVENEVMESKVDEINVGGLDEFQDYERDKVFKVATNAENLWVDSKDTVKSGHLEDSLELAGSLDAGHEIEKLEEGGTASNVTRAIVAVLDWNSSPDTSATAVSFLESVKFGDHLVRLRWDELNPTERRDFANVVTNSMYEIANPCGEWALQSQTAALSAEIVKREGFSTWLELLPSLISLSNSGPIQTDLVSMMIRWLPEDIMVHNEDLEGDRRRLLLRGLTESLPKILPMWYILLERHFGATLSEAGRKQMDIVKQHAASVTATLNGANTYVEWAPIPDLSNYGIIHGCGILLSSPDSCLHAYEFFKSVSSRKQPVDATSKFDSTVGDIFQVLINISRDFLIRLGSDARDIGDSEFEFVEYICESLVSLGSLNLQCISGDSAILLFYLQQMLGYFQHFKLALHYESLLFWLTLIRDLLSKPRVIAHAAGENSINNLSPVSRHVNKGKLRILTFLNGDVFSAMLEISSQWMLKKERVNTETTHSLGTTELWSDDFEGKGKFSQYHSRQIELIRFVTSSKPVIAAIKVFERIITIINFLLLDPTSAQYLAVMENIQLALEYVVSAVYEGSTEYDKGNSEIQLSWGRIIEVLFQQRPSLKRTEPALVELLGHYLVALGPFLKYHTDVVGSVINKLFELLTSIPFDLSTSTAQHARLQIYTSSIRIAKRVGKSFLPHMKAMSYLQKEGGLLHGDHNLLREAFHIMVSESGVQQQQKVPVRLLELNHGYGANPMVFDPGGFWKLSKLRT